MSEWISVKDRLPETGVEVLAYSDGDIYTVVHCIDGSWIASSTYYDLYHVTHWMPLPEPPDNPAAWWMECNGLYFCSNCVAEGAKHMITCPKCGAEMRDER